MHDKHHRLLTLPTIFSIILTALLACAITPPAFTQDMTTRYGDIIISIESAPEGESYIGYVETELLVANASTSQEHSVEVYYPYSSWGSGDRITQLSRTVTVGPAASAKISLLQPPVNIHGNGIQVVIDRIHQRKRMSFDEPDHAKNSHRYGRTASQCLFVSRDPKLDSFDDIALRAIISEEKDPALIRASGGFGMPGMVPAKQNFQFVKAPSDLRNWPDNWLAYSRYNGVVITAEQMNTLPENISAALKKYVNTGGSLLIAGNWQPESQWHCQSSSHPADSFNIWYCGFGIISSSENPESWNKSLWKFILEEMWISTGQARQNKKNVREANNWFPVIDDLGIPARGLLLLVAGFALIIGPANIFILARLNKRMHLFWTVPVISATGAMAILGYAYLGEGWKVRTKSTEITILNQSTQQAHTLAVQAFYAPITPSQGLHYDYETEVTPLGLHDYNGRGRTIDWTIDQHLKSGWVTARVPAHFLLRKPQLRRERINFRISSNSKTHAVNGLGKTITKLWYADSSANIHFAENIPPGKEIELHTLNKSIADTATPNKWRKIHEKDWPSQIKSISANPAAHLKPGTYIALLEEMLFTEMPLEDIQSTDALSVIYGINLTPQNQTLSRN